MFYACILASSVAVLIGLPNAALWVAIFLTLGAVTALGQILLACARHLALVALTAPLHSPSDGGEVGG